MAPSQLPNCRCCRLLAKRSVKNVGRNQNQSKRWGLYIVIYQWTDLNEESILVLGLLSWYFNFCLLSEGCQINGRMFTKNPRARKLLPRSRPFQASTDWEPPQENKLQPWTGFLCRIVCLYQEPQEWSLVIGHGPATTSFLRPWPRMEISFSRVLMQSESLSGATSHSLPASCPTEVWILPRLRHPEFTSCGFLTWFLEDLSCRFLSRRRNPDLRWWSLWWTWVDLLLCWAANGERLENRQELIYRFLILGECIMLIAKVIWHLMMNLWVLFFQSQILPSPRISTVWIWVSSSNGIGVASCPNIVIFIQNEIWGGQMNKTEEWTALKFQVIWIQSFQVHNPQDCWHRTGLVPKRNRTKVRSTQTRPCPGRVLAACFFWEMLCESSPQHIFWKRPSVVISGFLQVGEHISICPILVRLLGNDLLPAQFNTCLESFCTYCGRLN